jgi:hypothetical protein
MLMISSPAACAKTSIASFTRGSSAGLSIAKSRSLSTASGSRSKVRSTNGRMSRWANLAQSSRGRDFDGQLLRRSLHTRGRHFQYRRQACASPNAWTSVRAAESQRNSRATSRRAFSPFWSKSRAEAARQVRTADSKLASFTNQPAS